MKLIYIPAQPLLGNALELTFDDIANVAVIDAYNVNDWNTLFELPSTLYGGAFSRVQIAGNTVKLFGGSGITLKSYFSDNTMIGNHLVSVDDYAECLIALGTFAIHDCIILEAFTARKVTTVALATLFRNIIAVNYNLPFLQSAGAMAFASNPLMTEFYFESLQSITDGMFQDCPAAELFYFSNVQDIGTYAFNRCTSANQFYLPSLQTITGSYVWYGITGRSILLTVPHAMMIMNGGNPHPEIQDLMSHNTVTVVEV